MHRMTGEPVVNTTETFSRKVSVPIAIDEERYKYVPIVAVFRRIPPESVDQWVMRDGKPRSDRELASEVLVDVRKPIANSGSIAAHELRVADVLHLDRAAAIIVSTFLSVLPRGKAA